MYKKLSRLFIFVLILTATGCGPEGNGNARYESFNEVKQILLEQVYQDHRITFYCACTFSKNKKVRCKTGEGKRATLVEWEHIVPASQFGRTFSSWEKYTPFTCEIPDFIRKIFSIKCNPLSARENARRVSRAYRLMESDMYNLVPAIGLINQKRSNSPYGMIPGEKREFGNCDFEVSDKYVEPAPNIRGDIARTYFYMNDVYPGKNIITSQDEEKMFREWDKEDPVDEWECERCKRIENYQGNQNLFVKTPCQKKGLL